MSQRVVRPKHIVAGPVDESARIANRPYFFGHEIRQLYAAPTPTTNRVVVGVLSFGGDLDISDCTNYWTNQCNMTSLPKVIKKYLPGAIPVPGSVSDATYENALDVQMVGAMCPTANLTIILYIAPSTNIVNFRVLMDNALNIPVTDPDTGAQLKPSIVSISWGLPEDSFRSILDSTLVSIEQRFATAVGRGINICAASGDNGARDNPRSSRLVCDYPAASPYVIGCGGTRLVSSGTTYSPSATTETAWPGSGGGDSRLFSKPAFQASVRGSRRAVPDVALVADPNTGVIVRVNGGLYRLGGTSVSAPLFAGFLACKATTTNVRAALYTAPSSAFNDIRSGSNGGFRAGVGYDRVTGRGSPAGAVLSGAILTGSGGFVV